MLSLEEREEIINAAVERALIKLPEVVGSLMQNQAAMMKLSRQFFEKHPELKTEKALIQSVFEQVESDNPGMPYAEVIAKAYPIIKDRLNIKQSLNMTEVSKPNRTVSSSVDLGEL